jgi:hypothetical protein
MSRGIEDDKEALLRTVAQTYALDGKTLEVELLAEAEVEVVESDYDNWNGGTYGYTLYLRAPAALFVRLRANLDAICEDIKARMEPLLSVYDNTWLRRIVVTPKVER